MPVFAGDNTYAADLNSIETELVQRGLIARAQRPTTKTITTSETGILRLDSLPLKAGRAYKITAPHLRVDFVTATDRAAFRFRVSTSGAAGTGSSAIARVETGDVQSAHLEAMRIPGSDEVLSVLLCGIQYVGSSTATVQGDESGIEIWVEDLGPATADTGVDI
jgi:hypothetical protein